MFVTYPTPSVDEETYTDITRYHYSNVIDDVSIVLVNDYEEAINYIKNHSDTKSVLFYYKDNISVEEHQELQMKTYKIQLYSIISHFTESSFPLISHFLYDLYSIVYATTILSNIDTLNQTQLKLVSATLHEIHKYDDKDLCINPLILHRCENILKRLLNK